LEIAEPRDLVFEGVGASPLSGGFALRQRRGGRCLVGLLPRGRHQCRVFPFQGRQLAPQSLDLLPRSIDFAMCTVFDRADILKVGFPLNDDRCFMSLQTITEGQQFLLQAIGAMLRGVALLKEIAHVGVLALSQALRFSEAGFGKALGVLGRDLRGRAGVRLLPEGNTFGLQTYSLGLKRSAVLVKGIGCVGPCGEQCLLPQRGSRCHNRGRSLR